MNDAPVFILSAPRSGTTWLVRALGAHPAVHATELRAFGEYVDLIRDQGSAAPRLRITLDTYIDALLNPHAWPPLGPTRTNVRDDLVREVYGTLRAHALGQTGKTVFVDKLTPYFGTSDRAVASIARLFPDARIIHLVRDGRDVAVSGVMHWLTKDDDQTSAEQAERRAFFAGRVASLARFFSDADLEQWTTHWREPIDALQVHGHAFQRLVVRYEDMSADLATALRRIFEFIEVRAADDVIRRCTSEASFEAMSGGRVRGTDSPGAHVRKGVVGDWRGLFTQRDAAIFDRIAGRTLVEWNYEPDNRWTQVMPERLALRPPHAI